MSQLRHRQPDMIHSLLQSSFTCQLLIQEISIVINPEQIQSHSSRISLSPNNHHDHHGRTRDCAGNITEYPILPWLSTVSLHLSLSASKTLFHLCFCYPDFRHRATQIAKTLMLSQLYVISANSLPGNIIGCPNHYKGQQGVYGLHS